MKIKRIFAAFFAFIIIASAGLSVVSAAEPTYTVSKQYKSGKYYDNLINIPLSGNQAVDVIAVALSQLGYHEGDSNADLDGMNVDGTRDFVEYNVLYGKLDNNQGNGLSYGYYWCASFVNWCLRQAGVSKEASAAAEVSCRRWLAKCDDAGIYNGKKNYTPKSADLIFFKDADAGVTATHMGIVLYCDGKRVYTVEGNTSSGDYSSDGNYVTTKVYSLSSPYIVGYASPKYETDANVKFPDYTSKKLSPGVYVSEKDIECYSDMEMSEKVENVEAFTVFRVEEIINDSFKLILENDGEERIFWADLRGSARQLTVDNDVFSVSFLSGDREIFSRQYRISDTSIYIPDEIPPRDEAKFLGWTRDKDSKESLISPGTLLDAEDNDVVLYAVWDTIKYNILFITPDGEIISDQSGYYGESFSIPETAPAPIGYEFDCWNQKDITGIIECDMTFTAVYKKIEGYENRGERKQIMFDGCASAIGASSFSAIITAIAFVIVKPKKR